MEKEDYILFGIMIGLCAPVVGFLISDLVEAVKMEIRDTKIRKHNAEVERRNYMKGRFGYKWPMKRGK